MSLTLLALNALAWIASFIVASLVIKRVGKRQTAGISILGLIIVGVAKRLVKSDN